MDTAPRHRARDLVRDDVPVGPGVYAWYRRGRRMYVGKAASLRARLWQNHLGRSRSPTSSAFRRNVAEMLGHGSATELKKRTVTLSDAQLAEMLVWIRGCEVAWLTCRSDGEARAIETALKAEDRPKLTRR